MEEWISKKELLQETGISYGQLYRWKRERLIPESWFEKRSSFTGQETFFPRALMIERVRFIQEHKDRYSLTALKELLVPDSVSRAYALSSVCAVAGTERVSLFYQALGGPQPLNHGQALAVMIAAGYDSACHPDDRALAALLGALLSWQEQGLFTRSAGEIQVLRSESGILPLFSPSKEALWLPEGVRAEYTLSINEIARTYTRALNEINEVNGYGE